MRRKSRNAGCQPAFFAEFKHPKSLDRQFRSLQLRELSARIGPLGNHGVAANGFFGVGQDAID